MRRRLRPVATCARCGEVKLAKRARCASCWKQAESLYEDGATYERLMPMLGCASVGAVCNGAKRMGWRARPPGFAVGRFGTDVQRAREAHRRYMAFQATARHLARELGVSASALWRRWSALGLDERRGKRVLDDEREAAALKALHVGGRGTQARLAREWGVTSATVRGGARRADARSKRAGIKPWIPRLIEQATAEVRAEGGSWADMRAREAA